MNRRDLLALLGGCGAAIPSVTARAQQRATPVVGYLSSGSRDATT